jgi:threonine/homoserine efflux transporter RhtA
VRPILALVAGGAVAAAGAVVLGEYSFAGPAVISSGLLLGLFVAEAVLAVQRAGSVPAAVGAALFTAAGLVWAAWIATGHRVGEVRWDGWLAVALGALTAAFRSRPAGAARSRPAPAGTD